MHVRPFLACLREISRHIKDLLLRKEPLSHCLKKTKKVSFYNFTSEASFFFLFYMSAKISLKEKPKIGSMNLARFARKNKTIFNNFQTV